MWFSFYAINLSKCMNNERSVSKQRIKAKGNHYILVLNILKIYRYIYLPFFLYISFKTTANNHDNSRKKAVKKN